MSDTTLVPTNENPKPTKSRKGIGGRPSAYRPDEFPGLAYKYALLGATNQKIADFLGVPLKTFEHWQRVHPEFSGALVKGRHEADATIAKSMFKKATGYYKRTEKGTPAGPVQVREWYPPDTASMIFWLKNRQPELWRDKVQNEHTHTLTISAEFEQLIRQINQNKPRVIEAEATAIEQDFAPNPVRDAAE